MARAFNVAFIHIMFLLSWRNGLESKGLKVVISKTKVMRCALDVAPKEAAVDSCSVCVKRVGVNLIHCTSCGYCMHE